MRRRATKKRNPKKSPAEVQQLLDSAILEMLKAAEEGDYQEMEAAYKFAREQATSEAKRKQLASAYKQALRMYPGDDYS